MPVRQSVEKKVLGGPQGSDAFVILKRLTVEESNAFTEKFERLQEETKEAESSGEEQSAAQIREKNEGIARTEISKLILGWNWVDVDGSQMGQPHNNPDAIAKLYNEELEWITLALLDRAPEQLAAAKKKHK